MLTLMLIGAGQIGSRHFQSLKRLSLPSSVDIIDPSPESLATARARYASAEGTAAHHITYHATIPENPQIIDVAIVATSSNIRMQVIRELLNRHTVRYLILEKLLFDRPADYAEAEQLFAQTKVKAWVNCPMRITPFYESIKPHFEGTKIFYRMSGGDWGLMCNAIHFIDHLAYLSQTFDYTVDLRLLDPHLFPAKRKGFLELNGTLLAYFANGSLGMFTSHPSGDAPIVTEISNQRARVIIREAERKAWISRADEKWQWHEIETIIPYQSELTHLLVEQLIQNGACNLPSYQESAILHLQHLEPIRTLLHREDYPFT